MDGTRTDGESLWEIEVLATGIGALAGGIAGIAMGLILQFGTGLMPVLGSLIGESSVFLGWIVHLAISVIYGTIFAFIVAYPPVRSFLRTFDVADFTLAGIVYAVMMAAATVTILPFVFSVPWLTAASTPPFPNVPGPSLGGLVPAVLFGVAHLVYGAILGGIYGFLAESE